MLNVITLFSGYDSQCLALNRLGVDYDLTAWAEIDPYAIEAHNALFPQWSDRNLGDISKIDWSVINKPIDLMTYSSPCTDFSFAGKQRGGEKGSGTQSSLLWECERAISALRPKHLVFENVPALLSSKFMSTFLEWVRTLESYGYTNNYSIMNASDYGVPQSRKRVFMVSTLGGDRPYVFPKPFKLDPNAIGNAMECDVAPKYYLNDMRLGVFIENEKHKTAARRVIKTLTTQSGVVEMELLNGVGDFAASTLTTAHDFAGNIVNPRGGHKQMGILEKITGNTAEGTSGICEREITENGRRKRIRIRKLTERECFRLMDVDEACIDKVMETGIAKAKLTKMAGNSIVVACLYHIFKGLFGESTEQPSLF